jgi:hypothetical protein
MKNALKYTYLLDVINIRKELQKLWDRYQDILNNPNWEDLNEARAILYLIGYWYPEEVAPNAIERRLHLLDKPLTLMEFFTIIDTKNQTLIEKRKDKLFVRLEEFYKLIKEFKNLHVGGKWYLDEEKFVELYNKYSPDKNMMIRERGKFGTKK